MTSMVQTIRMLHVPTVPIVRVPHVALLGSEHDCKTNVMVRKVRIDGLPSTQ